MGDLIKAIVSSSIFLAVVAGIVAAGVVSLYFMMGGGGTISAVIVSGLVSTLVVLIFKIYALEAKISILAEMTQNGFNQMSEDVTENMIAQQENNNEDIQEIFGVLAKIMSGGE